MEIVAVVDQPFAKGNAPDLIDGNVFCVDRGCWVRTPTLLDVFMQMHSGSGDFVLPDGVEPRLVGRPGIRGIVEWDTRILINMALMRSEDVRMHLLLDGDDDRRDILPYYLAAAGYLGSHGGMVNVYAKNAGGAFAGLAMCAHKRYMLESGKLTFRNPLLHDPVASWSPKIAGEDNISERYWNMVKEFLLRNTVPGMQQLMRARLRQVEQNPANVQRQIPFSSEIACDIGLIEEPLHGIDALCRKFEERACECVGNLPEDHSVNRFFDVSGREQRHLEAKSRRERDAPRAEVIQIANVRSLGKVPKPFGTRLKRGVKSSRPDYLKPVE
ncbi:hypothetical protein HY604_04250 [Candidatus Peregrinibacteria bacterium]|nr:hypothetical protein [Candidatus Peregrinibacteria bacterium]